MIPKVPINLHPENDIKLTISQEKKLLSYVNVKQTDPLGRVFLDSIKYALYCAALSKGFHDKKWIITPGERRAYLKRINRTFCHFRNAIEAAPYELKCHIIREFFIHTNPSLVTEKNQFERDLDAGLLDIRDYKSTPLDLAVSNYVRFELSSHLESLEYSLKKTTVSLKKDRLGASVEQNTLVKRNLIRELVLAFDFICLKLNRPFSNHCRHVFFEFCNETLGLGMSMKSYKSFEEYLPKKTKLNELSKTKMAHFPLPICKYLKKVGASKTRN